jgi:hypothetical protein
MEYARNVLNGCTYWLILTCSEARSRERRALRKSAVSSVSSASRHGPSLRGSASGRRYVRGPTQRRRVPRSMSKVSGSLS